MLSLQVVKYCASEVLRQGDMNPMSTYDMVNAWDYARRKSTTQPWPTQDDLMIIAHHVKNYSQANAIMDAANYRRVPVIVNGFPTGAKWHEVPHQMNQLCGMGVPKERWWVDFENSVKLDLYNEWIYKLLKIHPWIDGNGRTASIAYNWIFGTLDHPQPLPHYDFGNEYDETD